MKTRKLKTGRAWGHKAITPPEVLFQKIEDAQVAEWTERFGGGKE